MSHRKRGSSNVVWTSITTTTILRPFFWDNPGEPVPEENFWTLWCKGRLTEADTHTDQPAGHHSIRNNQYPLPSSSPMLHGEYHHGEYSGAWTSHAASYVVHHITYNLGFRECCLSWRWYPFQNFFYEICKLCIFYIMKNMFSCKIRRSLSKRSSQNSFPMFDDTSVKGRPDRIFCGLNYFEDKKVWAFDKIYMVFQLSNEYIVTIFKFDLIWLLYCSHTNWRSSVLHDLLSVLH